MNTSSTRSKRTGNYSVLMVLLLTILMGFGALSMDVSLMRLGQSQAQDIADAVAHAAVVVLKQGGTQTEARTAAEEVIASNTIAGIAPQLLELEFGNWDTNARTFIAGGSPSGAAQVQIGLVGGNSLPLLMGPLFGWTDIEVRGQATAAIKNLQVILVMDITSSWRQKHFNYAREASVAFLNIMHENYGEDDLIGMTVFQQRFGWEYTPFTKIADSAANSNLILNDWNLLHTASFAGDFEPTWETGSYINTKFLACKVYASKGDGASPWGQWPTCNSSCYKYSSKDDYNASSPAGGCSPNMPRNYSDEGGTDHTTGMEMARTMFNENIDPLAYKAMLVLTDGKAAGYTAKTGKRVATGYVEPFREYKRAGAHSTVDIEADTPILAEKMYQELGVNIWFISFVESRPFMEASAKGDGWYINTTDAAQLVPIFEKIAQSLPISIVN
jgi:hypothetical protein